jgi:hypothetical protein
MFSVIHYDGSGDADIALEKLGSLFDELSKATAEHGDVSVVHDSGWAMSAHRDGRFVFEHLRDGGERHMVPVSRERVLELWVRLIEQGPDSVLGEPWKSGYT